MTVAVTVTATVTVRKALAARTPPCEGLCVISIGLLLVGAAIGLHADIVGELPKPQAQELIATIERAAAKRAQAPVILDDQEGGCDEIERCITAVRSRTSSFELLLLRLVAGPTKTRVIAEHYTAEATSVPDARSEVDVSRDPQSWAEAIERLVVATVPVRSAKDPAALLSVAPARAEPFPWAGTLTTGAGAALLAVGAGLAIGSAGSRSSASGTARAPEDTRALLSSAGTQAILADVALVVGAGVIAFGGALFFQAASE